MWQRGLTVILLVAVLAICPLFCISQVCCTLEGLLSCRGEHGHAFVDEAEGSSDEHRQEHHGESHSDCVCSGAVLAKQVSPQKMDASSLWFARSVEPALAIGQHISVRPRSFASPHFTACDSGRAILQATGTLLI